jgi:tetratricopeptide (TPR) repeat protein
MGDTSGDGGQLEEALKAAVEAVAHHRALAQGNPDALPDLARSLDTLGQMLHEAERYEEALTAAVETVALRRALVRPYPDNTRFDLVSSLFRLGFILTSLERFEEALAPFQESLDTLWPFLPHFPTFGELAEILLSQLRLLHSILERPLPVSHQERGAVLERLKKSGRVLLS